jgi:chloramphenicol 3-O phosphotransferase
MTVIFINGCTSAGKSSIARSLQSQLDTPYLLTGIDDAFGMIPLRYHNSDEGFKFVKDNNNLVQLSFGEIGKQTLYAHQVATSAMANSGVNLILDEVVLNERLRRDWLALLEGVDVFFVGVHCDLAELERRELARGDRVIGQARGQFQNVHSQMRYDFEIETTQISPDEAASFVISQRSRW